MKSKKYITKSLVGCSLYLILIFNFSLAVADGPVAASSLPGGASFTNGDSGSGETWGRSGGVNWSFSDFELTRFDNLTWGAVDASSVGIALDGTINSGSEEVLSLSSVIGNQATWIGATRIELYTTSNSTYYELVDTRFVLTVTSGGGPLALEVSTVNNLPYVNVIAANGQFVANLRMEAKLQSASIWEGVLDLFDRLSTVGDGIAMTTFNSGFFFDLASGSGGLSLEAHDTNMVNQTSQISGDLEFLTIESVNRLIDLGDKASTLENLIRGLSSGGLSLEAHDTNIVNQTSQISGDLENLTIESINRLIDLGDKASMLENLILGLSSGDGGGISPDEIRQIVDDSRQELINIFLFLWGLSPGGEGFPDPSTIPQISDLSTQESVDALALLLSDLPAEQSSQFAALNAQINALQQQLSALQAIPVLTLEVIGSHRSSNNTRRLLILSRENGVPTDASQFTINAVVESQSQGFRLEPVTFESRDIGDGLIEVNLNLPKSLRSTQIFHVTAVHDHGGGGAHSGATIIGGSAGATD